MNTPFSGRRRTALAATAALLLSTASPAQMTLQSQARSNYSAKGTFTVKMKPMSESGFGTDNANRGRMSLDKTFDGDLVGVGTGEMLTAMTQTKGSAGYVAMEQVTGTLNGRKGSFVLQHSGLMNRGAQSLVIVVVADSGSGDLIGLEGTFRIRIEGGKHFYDFDYSLPELLK